MTRFAMLVHTGIPDDDHYHYSGCYDANDDELEEAKAYVAEEAKLRKTLTFSDHVARMFTPLKGGLRYARTLDFALQNYEPNFAKPHVMNILHPLPLHLKRARTDAAACIDIVEEAILSHIECSALAYMKNPHMYNGQQFAWGATNRDDLETILEAFCAQIRDVWREQLFPDTVFCYYFDDDTTHEAPARRALAEYIQHYVEMALAVAPHHMIDDDGGADIYYDDLPIAADAAAAVKQRLSA